MAMLTFCVTAPLRSLFFRGPRWLGGWQGKDTEDICAEITSSPAKFWERHPNECDVVVEKQFQSYFVVFQVLVYGYLLCTTVGICLRACVFRYTVTMPLERMLLNAGSTARRIAHTWPEQTSPRPHCEAAPAPCKSLYCDTWGTVPEQNGPPH